MDVMDILGELLGHKTEKPGRGTDVLKDIFGRGSQRSSTPPSNRPADIKSPVEELEELLNVANQRSPNRRAGADQVSTRHSSSIPQDRSSSSPQGTHVGQNQDADNERAVVLIRAMVNAAKADGKLDEAEQKKIFERLGDPSRAELDFLRKEFASKLDIQKFARSVPVGMEQQVYTISLITIDLDEGSEANYLLELSQSLRIPADVREQIHQHIGAPTIY
jgi:hypothetical protein